MKANDIEGVPEDLFVFGVQESEVIVQVQQCSLLFLEV